MSKLSSSYLIKLCWTSWLILFVSPLQLKLQEHLQNVTGFHSVMKIFTDWLISGETSLSKLKTPSKLVEPIERQIKAHKVCP